MCWFYHAKPCFRSIRTNSSGPVSLWAGSGKLKIKDFLLSGSYRLCWEGPGEEVTLRWSLSPSG